MVVKNRHSKSIKIKEKKENKCYSGSPRVATKKNNMERKNKELTDRHEKASKGKKGTIYSIGPSIAAVDLDQFFSQSRVQLVEVVEDNKNIKKRAMVVVVPPSLKSFKEKKWTTYSGGPPTTATGIDLDWPFSRPRPQRVVVHRPPLKNIKIYKEKIIVAVKSFKRKAIVVHWPPL